MKEEISLKAPLAAADYLGDLYKMFNTWYLTASAYNMGEGKLRRLIKNIRQIITGYCLENKTFLRKRKTTFKIDCSVAYCKNT